MEKVIQDKDIHIGNLDEAICIKNTAIDDLNEAIHIKDADIDQLNKAVLAKDIHIRNQDAMIRMKDVHIGNIERQVQDMTNSASWKITRPFRVGMGRIKGLARKQPYSRGLCEKGARRG